MKYGAMEQVRNQLTARAARICGSRLTGVAYFDHFDHAQPELDVHIADAGVELLTDNGPMSLLWWESSHAPFGIDCQTRPMASLIPISAEGPMSRCVEADECWQPLLGHFILDVDVIWGTEVPDLWLGAASVDSLDFPLAIRLDTTGGSVWIISGCLLPANNKLIPGDEMIVAFDAETVASLGIPTTSTPTEWVFDV